MIRLMIYFQKRLVFFDADKQTCPWSKTFTWDYLGWKFNFPTYVLKNDTILMHKKVHTKQKVLTIIIIKKKNTWKGEKLNTYKKNK